jgi:hypothetical protein
MVMYYQQTIAAIREGVEKLAPGTTPTWQHVEPGQIVEPGYLLWMCEGIQMMDTTSLPDAFKAARWIGWTLSHAELLSLWNNDRSRDLIRSDRSSGLDKPHSG